MFCTHHQEVCNEIRLRRLYLLRLAMALTKSAFFYFLPASDLKNLQIYLLQALIPSLRSNPKANCCFFNSL